MSNFLKIILAAMLMAFAAPSFAQATRTWVSGVGDDVNPCSRTAPCKTFAGAISKTAANGEINCLDPGGFGTLTITKSLTIDCTGTMGSVLNAGGINGIVINDSATGTPNTIDVIIRGIAIDGAGSTPGLTGIRFLSGRSLIVEDVFIQNQNGANGMFLAPTGAATVQLENVTLTDGNGGVTMSPAAAGSLRVTMRNVRAHKNSGAALNLSTASSTAAAGVVVAIDKSSFSGNGNGVFVTANSGTSLANVMINDSVMSNNASNGISATGVLARVRVGRSVISGNGTGVAIVSGAIVNTYGTNQLDGNTADGAFTSPAIPQR